MCAQSLPQSRVITLYLNFAYTLIMPDTQLQKLLLLATRVVVKRSRPSASFCHWCRTKAIRAISVCQVKFNMEFASQAMNFPRMLQYSIFAPEMPFRSNQVLRIEIQLKVENFLHGGNENMIKRSIIVIGIICGQSIFIASFQMHWNDSAKHSVFSSHIISRCTIDLISLVFLNHQFTHT